MKKIFRKIKNSLLYMKWISCDHNHLEPSGPTGWKCKDCKLAVLD